MEEMMGIARILGDQLDKKVFYIATGLALPFIILGGFSPAILNRASSTALNYITSAWGWFYLISCSFFVLTCLLIAVSPLGRVRLGRDNEQPEFSTLSWFSMLFSAGMGIGLVFWSVAEPMYHYISPPTGKGATPEAARRAFEIFFFHWGLHAWATYCVVGLAIAYFVFRKGKPATVSACLTPILGEKLMQGWIGDFVNSFAIWATIMGVVTSLGMGALQINSGFAFVFGIHTGPGTAALIIIVITFLFIMSAVSGVNKGIKILSLINIFLMLVLLLFFLIMGPFGYIIKTFFVALYDYVKELIPLSCSVELFHNPDWTKSWTIFYWAWWIAWAPFVGAFIARISRGRTIREFIFVVLVAPSLFSYIFSTGLGGTAVYLDSIKHVPIGIAVQKSVESALFITLKQLPWFGFIAILTNLLIASFFITSADSATFVITQFSVGGEKIRTRKYETRVIIFWGVVLAALAVVLIYSGGLKALQTASIVGAFPFLLVMYFLLASSIKDLFKEIKLVIKI